MQYGAPGRQLDMDFGGEGGHVWRATSALLFWEDTEQSCWAVGMLPTDTDATRRAGSLSLLWPVFLSLGLGQFIETMVCALSGGRPMQEVGMTIFEHSLAFAEAEAVVTKPLTMDTTRFFKPQPVFTPDGTSLLIPRSKLSTIVNVPPEVLLIALISCFSHFTSNILAIAGVRSRYRLVTTAIWGLAYMSTFAWSFTRLATTIADGNQPVGILRFPAVCIVGFIPHILILTGIAACGVIYLLALFITILSPPPGQPGPMTLKERFAAAYGNLHANIHLSSITPLTINWNEDFYTAILKVGFTVLTAASEAVFLNEGPKINLHAMTWLEKQRMQEVLARRRRFRQNLTNIPSELRDGIAAEGVEVVDSLTGNISSATTTSGYAQERKTRSANGASDVARAAGRNDPAGLQQRRGRFFLTYQFFKGISRLIMVIHARLTIAILRQLRISYRPRWLRYLAGPRVTEKARVPESRSGRLQRQRTAESWITLDDRSRIRLDKNTDVEELARERLRQSGYLSEPDSEESQERVSEYLYAWWRNGGKYNDVDTSGDYVPPLDDDTTSVVSFAETTDDEWSDEEDGQRTPTRETYQRSREETPTAETTIDLSRLSHLLDPKTKEDREEAKLLARHLQSPNIMTRSQYRKVLERDETRILASSRYAMDGLPDTDKMTPEDEEQVLEDFILNRRETQASQGPSGAGSWNTGGEGMGADGPQCVVCQLAPRTVLVWPCGCLSLCDDCRVGLASKNYTTCVCCRTNVVAYSRLYVP